MLQINKNLSDLLQEDSRLTNQTVLTVITGMPGSGKSALARANLRAGSYVSMDDFSVLGPDAKWNFRVPSGHLLPPPIWVGQADNLAEAIVQFCAGFCAKGFNPEDDGDTCVVKVIHVVPHTELFHAVAASRRRALCRWGSTIPGAQALDHFYEWASTATIDQILANTQRGNDALARNMGRYAHANKLNCPTLLVHCYVQQMDLNHLQAILDGNRSPWAADTGWAPLRGSDLFVRPGEGLMNVFFDMVDSVRQVTRATLASVAKTRHARNLALAAGCDSRIVEALTPEQNDYSASKTT